jgi:hypothetical protein
VKFLCLIHLSCPFVWLLVLVSYYRIFLYPQFRRDFDEEAKKKYKKKKKRFSGRRESMNWQVFLIKRHGRLS